MRPYSVFFPGKPTPSPGESVSLDFDAVDDDDSRKKRKRVEAVLFLSKSPLSLRKLAQLAHLADATEARTLVRELNTAYESHGRAIRVEMVAGGYRLMTRPAIAPWLARLGHLPIATRLSTPMMETLAVVAYRQNVSRADVEAIRGVACGELLRQLMERDLIRIAGRSEELGRPYLYGTTKRFLKVFGLASTEGLPPIQWQILQEAEADPSSAEQRDPTNLDSSPKDSFSSTKESVVSTAVASVLPEADSELLFAIEPSELKPSEQAEATLAGMNFPSEAAAKVSAIIEDEEDELFGDDDDDEEDDLVEVDLDDDDDEDEEWDDDDDDEDELDDEEEVDEIDDEEVEEDELEDDWEEVDDEDEDWEDDDEDDDDWEDDDDDEADDDEDWA